MGDVVIDVQVFESQQGYGVFEDSAQALELAAIGLEVLVSDLADMDETTALCAKAAVALGLVIELQERYESKNCATPLMRK